MTALDFVGVYDALIRLKTMGFKNDFSWELCAFTKDVSDERSLHILPTQIGQSLAGYDLLLVPGGFGAVQFMKDERFLRNGRFGLHRLAAIRCPRSAQRKESHDASNGF